MNNARFVAAVLVAMAMAVPGGARAMPAMPMIATAETAHYRLMLQIGPEEKMYSKADAAKMHPGSGEIMVSGTMTGLSGMQMQQGMAMDMRHLEVHVADRATGKVVTDVACRITVTDAAGKSRAVPIAAMYGVKEGVSDRHYGNNVVMPPGSYTVTVVVNGEQAVFHVTIPRM